jgi:hypothetical protein
MWRLYGSLDADLGSARRSRRLAPGAARRRLLRQRRSPDAVSTRNQSHGRRQSVLGRKIWAAASILHDARARLQRRRLQHRLGNPLGAARIWSRGACGVVETGSNMRAAASPLELQTDVFYMRRQNMQVYLSEQLQQNNPLNYVFYTQNASNGENYGFEGEAAYRLSSRWDLSGSALAAAHALSERERPVRRAWTSMGARSRSRPATSFAAAAEYHDPSAGSRAWTPRRSTASTTTRAMRRPRAPTIWKTPAWATSAAAGRQASGCAISSMRAMRSKDSTSA